MKAQKEKSLRTSGVRPGREMGMPLTQKNSYVGYKESRSAEITMTFWVFLTMPAMKSLRKHTRNSP